MGNRETGPEFIRSEELKNIVRIGTRGSPLALAQAHYVKHALQAQNTTISYQIVTLQTSGDRFLEADLKTIGGKGLFTKEIEQALIEKKIDLAVHSMKDVPTKRQNGLEILAVLPREDPRDAFISHKYASFKELPHGAHIGTASLRRGAQLRRMRPDLRISLLRGNVQTRIKKVEDGYFDATLLAVAGLNRLGRQDVITEIFDIETFPPAPAQGAIGIETSIQTSPELKNLIKTINCNNTHLTVTAERAFLAALDGNCQTPIAAYADIEDDTIRLRGHILSENGLRICSKKGSVPIKDAYILGTNLGQQAKDEFYA